MTFFIVDGVSHKVHLFRTDHTVLFLRFVGIVPKISPFKAKQEEDCIEQSPALFKIFSACYRLPSRIQEEFEPWEAS